MTDHDQQEDNSEDPCPHCGGEGYIEITEGDPEHERLQERYGEHAWAYMTERRCICKQREKFHSQVGDAIYQAERLDDSALWDRTDDNLFVSSHREDFLPHLRYVLAQKGLEYAWARTTDSELRDIYVGDHDTYDSLGEYIERPSLVIIQLAVLSYKNVAMSGILMETLRIRQFEDKSTWIVNPPDEPFDSAHEAYSESLNRYINDHFDRMVIEPSRDRDSSGAGSAKPSLSASGGLDDLL